MVCLKKTFFKDQEKDFQPFVFGRQPLKVINWRYENGDTRTQGQFSDILFLPSELVLDENTGYDYNVAIAVRMTREYIIVMATEDCRTIDYTGVYRDFTKGEVIRVEENPLKKVPCRRVDLGKSLVVDAVPASAQALNIQTASFVGTFDANFSQKWVSGAHAPEDGMDVWDKPVIYFTQPDAKYNVTPNPPNQINNAKEFISDLQDFYDNLMQQEYNNMAKKGQQVPSGEALKEINAPKHAATKYILDQIADALSDIIAWMHELAGEAMPDVQVVMPETFDMPDDNERIANALDAQDISYTTKDGAKIAIRKKWEQLTSGPELEQVVQAELAAELPKMQAMNDMDAAGAGSNFDVDESGDLSGGDTENQAEAEGVEDVV